MSLVSHTSLEMRRWWLFLIRTLTGLWTSSEDVPDAWSLSPSEPIFTFSWTIPTKHRDANKLSGIALCFHSTQVFLTAFFCFVLWHSHSPLLLYHFLHQRTRAFVLDFIHPSEKAIVGSQSPDDGLYHQPRRGVSQVSLKCNW